MLGRLLSGMALSLSGSRFPGLVTTQMVSDGLVYNSSFLGELKIGNGASVGDMRLSISDSILGLLSCF